MVDNQKNTQTRFTKCQPMKSVFLCSMTAIYKNDDVVCLLCAEIDLVKTSICASEYQREVPDKMIVDWNTLRRERSFWILTTGNKDTSRPNDSKNVWRPPERTRRLASKFVFYHNMFFLLAKHGRKTRANNQLNTELLNVLSACCNKSSDGCQPSPNIYSVRTQNH